MPASDPFTRLCQTMAAPPYRGRADLHLHTTASDGRYTAAQILDLAHRSGLAAVAITDHDTMAGAIAARAAAPPGLEVIAAVEISAEWEGHEFHVLGYFVDPTHPGLTAALAKLIEHRVGRFRAMVERLEKVGIHLECEPLEGNVAIGRRHLAEMLVAAGKVGSVREAFTRYLHDAGPANEPKLLLPLAEAIAAIRAAGGVASYAHPPYTLTPDMLAPLKEVGLGAVEAEYPGYAASRTKYLRDLAGQLGLAISGGSDCHGPDDHKRTVGARTIDADDLERLRALARQ